MKELNVGDINRNIVLELRKYLEELHVENAVGRWGELEDLVTKLTRPFIEHVNDIEEYVDELESQDETVEEAETQFDSLKEMTCDGIDEQLDSLKSLSLKLAGLEDSEYQDSCEDIIRELESLKVDVRDYTFLV